MEVLLIYFSIIITPGERLDWCYSSGLSSVFFLLVLFKITKKRWGDDSPLFLFFSFDHAFFYFTAALLP